MTDEIEGFWAAGGRMWVSVLNSVVQQTDDMNLSQTQYLNSVKLNCLNWAVADARFC